MMGGELTEQNSIKNEVFSFYNNLHKSREHIIENVNLEEHLMIILLN